MAEPNLVRVLVVLAAPVVLAMKLLGLADLVVPVVLAMKLLVLVVPVVLAVLAVELLARADVVSLVVRKLVTELVAIVHAVVTPG